MPEFTLDRPATPEEVAAIAAALTAAMAEETVPAPAAPVLAPWRAAARVESLGLVRRIPGKLDLRYMGAPTRERLMRPLRSR